MKKLIFLFAILILNISAIEIYSQNRSIQFEETTWAAIVAKAKSENKMIFLDAYASWCSPCKYLAAKVFTVDSVADFYNKNFINAHFDMEKGEGIEVRAKYGVKVFPTLVFVNGDGEMVHQSAGSRPPSEFIQLGKDALNPEKQLITYRKKFESGNREPGFVMSYLLKLKDSYADFESAAAEYLKSVDEKDFSKKDNWDIISGFINNINSREIKYIIKNRDLLIKTYGEESVDGKIKSAFAEGFEKAIKSRTNSQAAYDSLKNAALKSGYTKADEVVLTAEFALYKKKKDTDNFIKTADAYLKLKSTKALDYNEAAWFVYENSTDKPSLEKAAGWAKKGLEMEEESGIYDTYANILFKLGNKAEAIKYEEKALELAKKVGEGVEDIQKTLDEMKK